MEVWIKRDLLPFGGMILTIICHVSLLEVMKIAMAKGVNKFVMMVYSNVLAILLFLISCFVKHRLNWPPLTFSLIWKFFLLSLFGTLMEIFAYVGIELSSAVLSTAMDNLIPALTFILAVLFRLENLNWRKKSSQAKSIGTVVAIGGAFVITFYKGPRIMNAISGSASFHGKNKLVASKSKWIMGGFFLAGEAFLSAAWYILQTIILKNFTSIFILMFFLASCGTITSTIFAVIMVKDSSAWKLKAHMGWFAVVYIAVVGCLFQTSFLAWCLSKKGPIYVTSFKPLSIVLSSFVGVVFLGDSLFLGRLMGAVIIIIGFYFVMWGKIKEEKTVKPNENENGGSEEEPHTS